MFDTTDSHVRDSEIVVLNIYTGNFVEYRLNEDGEVIIISTDLVDTQDTCIVTTWGNIYEKNLVKGKKNDN